MSQGKDLTDWVIDSLILTACQIVYDDLCPKVRESRSLFVHVFFFYVVVSLK